MPRLATRQSRPAGEHLSSDVAAPVRGQDEATLYRAVLDLADADLSDASLTINTILEGSLDGGATWAVFARGDGWHGGALGQSGAVLPPLLSWASSENRGLTRMRVRWSQSGTARVGASLETELHVVVRR